MRRDIPLIVLIVTGLSAAALISHWSDAHRVDRSAQFAEEQLYLGEKTTRRASLAFNGLAADWYWMRSLQYVGRKLIRYEDTHPDFQLTDLKALELRLLPSLLRRSTALDPQFMAPYEYGAVILPALDENEAIALLNSGIAANPNAWRLYQHLGYIYWQRDDFETASNIYATGAKLPGAPPWMAAMSARMKAEGGSRRAAREMYMRLDEASDDETVKRMVEKQVLRLDSLDERDVIRRTLNDYRTRTGRCASSWREVASLLQSARFRIDAYTGAPIDPSGVPYRLVNEGCDVELDPDSKVPPR